jgi:hypothetical protein
VGAKDLGLKFISVGCDDSGVFQDARVSMTIYMKEIIVPFMIRVHCFAH